MKSDLKYKFLSNLVKKKENEGFTLIELLVVVIIIGVLAAIALPNLLGQVGRARESEATNALGTLNRAQQTFHIGASDFATDINDLEVPVDGTHYSFSVGAAGEQLAAPIDAGDKGTRGFAGGVGFNTTDSTYSAVICRATEIGNTIATGTITVGEGSVAACGTTLETID